MELGDLSGPSEELPPDVPYGSLIGSLMYAGVCTRPNLSMAVGRLSRYLEKPSIVHWNAAKCVLKYLMATKRVGLNYEGEGVDLNCYVDTDWAGDVATRRSTSGMIVMLGRGSILGSSTRQRCMAYCRGRIHGTGTRCQRMSMDPKFCTTSRNGDQCEANDALV